MLRLRVLSWNLGPGNVGWQELAAVLAGWDWDVSVLRGLPGRWALPLATALDAEFRYAPTGSPERSRLRRLLSGRVRSPAASTGGEVDAILAQHDRIVSEWPGDARQAQRTGVHAARLACGIWIGCVKSSDADPAVSPKLPGAIGGEALVLAGPRSASGRVPLTEVAHGGVDAMWATPALRAVSDSAVLARGAVRGNPPLAVTLEHRGAVEVAAPDPDEPGSTAG